MSDEPDDRDDRREDAEEAAQGDEVVAGDRDVPPGDEKAPLSDLREEVSRRRERRGESRAEADVFEEMGDEADDFLEGEDVWERIVADADTAEAEGTPAGQVAFAESTATTEEGDVHVISDRVCHSCPYFGDPPDLHCEHDGTEIRRVVDMDHYEVEDCPMVREQ